MTISQTAVCNIVNGRGLMRQASENGQNYKIKAHRPIRRKSLIKRVEAVCKRENPITQRAAPNAFRCSLGTINKRIHNDLELDTRKKASMHRLNGKQKRQRVNAAKYLLAHELTDENLEFFVHWTRLSYHFMIVTKNETFVMSKKARQFRIIGPSNAMRVLAKKLWLPRF